MALLRAAGRTDGRSRVTGDKDFSAMPETDVGVSYEVAPEYLEHTCREALDNQDQPDLPQDV